jgi:hypothetical protein
MERRIGKLENAQLAGLSARRVEIVLCCEPRCQIKHTRAIEIVRFRAWSADTRGPSISVVKNKQRHPWRPRSMQGRCLHQDHLPEFIGRLQALCAHCLPRRPPDLGVSLAFKLLEIIRQQDLTSRRANFHFHVTSGQQLLCVLQRFRSCGMTNIDARELIAPADQEFQLLGLSHAKQLRRGEKARAVPAR